ncbi:hypothetical protein [Marinicella sp. W31]|uniref:hypothetical protein n=1 Tax=Marinicella sp. W31 TaxID=3023713 RepID=UPI003756553F
MKNITKIALITSLFGSTVNAAPVVFAQGGDDTAASIQAVVDDFRNTLGDLNAPEPVSLSNGRRQIDWDAAPDGVSAPNPFAGDFFNFNAFPRARGIVFNTAGTGFQLSATNASGVGINFANINPSYATEFGTFSAERLFTAIDSNIVEARFFLPGTNIPATVSGLGVVFTDVDTATSTQIEFYGTNNQLLTTQMVPAGTVSSQSLSFLGVYFDAGEQIARVRITSGDANLSAANTEGGGIDLVAMDDFIFGEPQGIPPTQVPTLSQWAMILLLISLVFLGMYRLNQRT